MLPSALWLLCLATIGARAQDSSSSSTSSGSSDSSSSTGTSSSNDNDNNPMTSLSFTNSLSTITGSIPTSAFTGSDYVYLSPTGQSTVTTFTETLTTNGTVETVTSTSTSSQNSQITRSSQSVSLTVIGGETSNATSTANQTSSSTSSAAQPTNTLPCNGFPEFCSRKYSNITHVAAHNAAFYVKNNAASNQELPIIDQLNDGVRMLQGQVHWENNTLWNCHTSCTLLNAGTWQSELEVVADWLAANPYDVLSILIGNSDNTDVENFVPAITNAGLLPYVYEPAYVPQYREQWPTLGEMILKSTRLVFYMDYGADQTKVPYILDEFTHMFETPFSPTNVSFPCTVQRPPNLNDTEARGNYMYMANHNLNTAVDLSSLGINTGDSEILLPNTADLNITNGLANQLGRLGAMSLNCTADWDRPPNFLLVDYYNIGSPMAGSVFHVAAAANNVTYTKQCCGYDQSAAPVMRASFVGLAVALIVTCFLAW